ncbi:MAG: succinate dehydrogenase, hydrophobic membrane anchor protein [Rhodospirillaceae bacterium]|mgnify:CR=1 FL=1|jgi:succinate dehydrogenase / fumarate reductase, membrane anchor subunit|nr:succinate dehydrogenase, hydrophobic membrane anchor protein [Rhodospirillaceae bacterium]
MQMRSHLARARGLGSSNDGVGHWWAQRLTGLALVPLSLWFIFSVVGLIGADLATVKAWAGRHGNPVMLILLTIAMFHHAQLGIQVVVEDYVKSEPTKVTLLVLTKFLAALFGASCIFAVLRLSFGG